MTLRWRFRPEKKILRLPDLSVEMLAMVFTLFFLFANGFLDDAVMIPRVLGDWSDRSPRFHFPLVFLMLNKGCGYQSRLGLLGVVYGNGSGATPYFRENMGC